MLMMSNGLSPPTLPKTHSGQNALGCPLKYPLASWGCVHLSVPISLLLHLLPRPLPITPTHQKKVSFAKGSGQSRSSTAFTYHTLEECQTWRASLVATLADCIPGWKVSFASLVFHPSDAQRVWTHSCWVHRKVSRLKTYLLSPFNWFPPKKFPPGQEGEGN